MPQANHVLRGGGEVEVGFHLSTVQPTSERGRGERPDLKGLRRVGVCPHSHPCSPQEHTRTSAQVRCSLFVQNADWGSVAEPFKNDFLKKILSKHLNNESSHVNT